MFMHPPTIFASTNKRHFVVNSKTTRITLRYVVLSGGNVANGQNMDHNGGAIFISSGKLNLHFARIENIDGEKKEVTMTPSSRLVLPLDAFMQFAEQVEKIKGAIVSEAEKVKENLELKVEGSETEAH